MLEQTMSPEMVIRAGVDLKKYNQINDSLRFIPTINHRGATIKVEGELRLEPVKKGTRLKTKDAKAEPTNLVDYLNQDIQIGKMLEEGLRLGIISDDELTERGLKRFVQLGKKVDLELVGKLSKLQKADAIGLILQKLPAKSGDSNYFDSLSRLMLKDLYHIDAEGKNLSSFTNLDFINALIVAGKADLSNYVLESTYSPYTIAQMDESRRKVAHEVVPTYGEKYERELIGQTDVIDRAKKKVQLEKKRVTIDVGIEKSADVDLRTSQAMLHVWLPPGMLLDIERSKLEIAQTSNPSDREQKNYNLVVKQRGAYLTLLHAMGVKGYEEGGEYFSNLDPDKQNNIRQLANRLKTARGPMNRFDSMTLFEANRRSLTNIAVDIYGIKTNEAKKIVDALDFKDSTLENLKKRFRRSGFSEELLPDMVYDKLWRDFQTKLTDANPTKEVSRIDSQAFKSFFKDRVLTERSLMDRKGRFKDVENPAQLRIEDAKDMGIKGLDLLYRRSLIPGEEETVPSYEDWVQKLKDRVEEMKEEKESSAVLKQGPEEKKEQPVEPKDTLGEPPEDLTGKPKLTLGEPPKPPTTEDKVISIPITEAPKKEVVSPAGLLGEYKPPEPSIKLARDEKGVSILVNGKKSPPAENIPSLINTLQESLDKGVIPEGANLSYGDIAIALSNLRGAKDTFIAPGETKQIEPETIIPQNIRESLAKVISRSIFGPEKNPVIIQEATNIIGQVDETSAENKIVNASPDKLGQLFYLAKKAQILDFLAKQSKADLVVTANELMDKWEKQYLIPQGKQWLDLTRQVIEILQSGADIGAKSVDEILNSTPLGRLDLIQRGFNEIARAGDLDMRLIDEILQKITLGHVTLGDILIGTVPLEPVKLKGREELKAAAPTAQPVQSQPVPASTPQPVPTLSPQEATAVTVVEPEFKIPEDAVTWNDPTPYRPFRIMQDKEGKYSVIRVEFDESGNKLKEQIYETFPTGSLDEIINSYFKSYNPYDVDAMTLLENQIHVEAFSIRDSILIASESKLKDDLEWYTSFIIEQEKKLLLESQNVNAKDIKGKSFYEFLVKASRDKNTRVNNDLSTPEGRQKGAKLLLNQYLLKYHPDLLRLAKSAPGDVEQKLFEFAKKSNYQKVAQALVHELEEANNKLNPPPSQTLQPTPTPQPTPTYTSTPVVPIEPLPTETAQPTPSQQPPAVTKASFPPWLDAIPEPQLVPPAVAEVSVQPSETTTLSPELQQIKQQLTEDLRRLDLESLMNERKKYNFLRDEYYKVYLIVKNFLNEKDLSNLNNDSRLASNDTLTQLTYNLDTLDDAAELPKTKLILGACKIILLDKDQAIKSSFVTSLNELASRLRSAKDQRNSLISQLSYDPLFIQLLDRYISDYNLEHKSDKGIKASLQKISLNKILGTPFDNQFVALSTLFQEAKDKAKERQKTNAKKAPLPNSITLG